MNISPPASLRAGLPAVLDTDPDDLQRTAEHYDELATFSAGEGNAEVAATLGHFAALYATAARAVALYRGLERPDTRAPRHAAPGEIDQDWLR